MSQEEVWIKEQNGGCGCVLRLPQQEFTDDPRKKIGKKAVGRDRDHAPSQE
jgi:hypothetical protein